MDARIKTNALLEKLPAHLQQFIKPQDYDLYTNIDQAIWRFVMRQNVSYLPSVAHSSYLEGLKKTGIEIDRIPNMYGMNRILSEIGWAAVAVDGFIPPNAFMEFQAHQVLVIASDMRQLEHIEYTPAPDILHEGAGHAPIIANREYAEYLRRFGEIGAKAISSTKDLELYEVIRTLSILKESETASEAEILVAEQAVVDVQNSFGELSEMGQIRNLHWWTVEYGLIGSVDDFKLYGAGLLSSIGESKSCMSTSIEKFPYTIEAAEIGFDITKPQPQLFVTPNFAHLSMVLENFANTMAVRHGGLRGIDKLIDSAAIGTIELSSGIQISGIFTNVITANDKPIYFQTSGKTALSYSSKELVGHSSQQHPGGFGSTLGKLVGIDLPIEEMSPEILQQHGLIEGKVVELKFEGGVVVNGEIITGSRSIKGKIMIITFKNCTVSHHGKILFDPSGGVYEMAVGQEVVSAFAGAADPSSFEIIKQVSVNTTHKLEMSAEKAELNELYGSVRNKPSIENCELIFEVLQRNHPSDWLLSIEILEIAIQENSSLVEAVMSHLNQLKLERPEVAQNIDQGIAIIKTEEIQCN